MLLDYKIHIKMLKKISEEIYVTYIQPMGRPRVKVKDRFRRKKIVKYLAFTNY